MLAVKTFLKSGLLRNNTKFYRLVHTNNNHPKEKTQTIIHVRGIDSNSTKISQFSKIMHRFNFSLSLIKKIIVCIILYIMMDSIFFPLYNFKQNAQKWMQENIEFKL